jgi:hypothetical protein
MITFYCDDSGKAAHDEYVHAVAYIGLEPRWQQFSIDWRLRLSRAGLIWFHASEFFPGAGEFASWKGDERAGERRILLMDLAGIIGSYTLQSFACAVHVPAWSRLNEEYCLRERCITPFPLAARTVVGLARNWVRESGWDHESMNFVFDQGCEDWGLLMDRLKTDHGIVPAPEDKRQVRPLQAADWFAYEAHKETPQSENWSDRTRDPRRSFLTLLNLSRAVPSIYREADIKRLCDDPAAHVPKRR